MTRGTLALLGLALAAPLVAEEPAPWPDPGPSFTQDLFPLNLVSLTYRPIGAETIGEGKWQYSLQVMRSNTLEFSDAIRNTLKDHHGSRIPVDRAAAEQFAKAHPNEPMLFYFDGEYQRTELQFRCGLTADTDLALTLGWLSAGGGCLDGLIEDVHRIGFRQVGRDAIARNRISSAIIQNGQVTYYSEKKIGCEPMDPQLTLVHRFHEGPRWTASFVGTVQIPLTTFEEGIRSDWDTSAGLAFQWRPSENHVFHGGVAYLRRALKDENEIFPFHLQDQVDGHLGWEWRGWARVRPFLMLVCYDALTGKDPSGTMDKPSLLHDLGMHVRMGEHTALTLSYTNNITHYHNTADLGFTLRLAVRP